MTPVTRPVYLLSALACGLCLLPVAPVFGGVGGKSYEYIAGLYSLLPPFDPGAMVFEASGTFRVDYGSEGVAGFVGTWNEAGGIWSAEFQDGAITKTYRGVSFGTMVLGMASGAGPSKLLFGSEAAVVPEPPAGEFLDDVLEPFDDPTSFFAEAVAVWQDVVVAGAAYDDHSGKVQAGSAYVYRKVGGNWTPDAKLIADDAGDFDHFGESVAVYGDTIAVGAYDATHSDLLEPGAVYVFRNTGSEWVQEAKLIASDPEEFQAFGWSVAVGPDTVAVGARFDDAVAEASGAVYVFQRTGPTTWGPPQKLKSDSPEYSDFFGGSVALSGDTLVVGADGRDVDGQVSAGAAFVFARNSGVWSQSATLTASDPKEFDDFGWSVGVSGDAAVVGSRDYVTVGNHTGLGAAYVFRRMGVTWSQEAKLTAADREAPDGFDNVAVAIDGDTVVMGVEGDYVGYEPSGSAYVFTRSGGNWQQQAKLLANDVQFGLYSHFGTAVALSGSTAVIGADGRDAAYVYDVAPLQPAPPPVATPASQIAPKVDAPSRPSRARGR
jgi:hypothetical protein